MMFEVGLVSSGAGLFSRPMGSPVGDGLGVDSPILEPVFFSDASAQLDVRFPRLDSRFVNTLRQTTPSSMELGVIPSSPPSFMQIVSAPLPTPAISSPPWRRRQSCLAPAIVPRRSARLAKKAASRPPVVVAA
jgi:hypothetical protein